MILKFLYVDNCLTKNHEYVIVIHWEPRNYGYMNKPLPRNWFVRGAYSMKCSTELDEYILDLLCIGVYSASVYSDNNRNSRDF